MTTKKKKKEHFLYLIEHGNETEMKLMTEVEAAHFSLIHEKEVWNVHTSLDMDPELLDIETL